MAWEYCTFYDGYSDPEAYLGFTEPQDDSFVREVAAQFGDVVRLDKSSNQVIKLKSYKVPVHSMAGFLGRYNWEMQPSEDQHKREFKRQSDPDEVARRQTSIVATASSGGCLLAGAMLVASALIMVHRR